MSLGIDQYSGVDATLLNSREVGATHDHICYLTGDVIFRTEKVLNRGVDESRYELLEGRDIQPAGKRGFDTVERYRRRGLRR